MTDEQIPSWAVELTKQIAVLNEKIPSHIEWSTRNLLDHEKRLRVNENTLSKLTDVLTRLEALEARVFQTERRIWMAVGGVAVIGMALEIYNLLKG